MRITDDDITKLVGDILLNAGIAALPIMELNDMQDATVALMEHVRSDAWFVTVNDPDGAIRAISPMDDAAHAVVLAALPNARPFEESGATEWANQQRWRVLASQRIERIHRRQGARDA